MLQPPLRRPRRIAPAVLPLVLLAGLAAGYGLGADSPRSLDAAGFVVEHETLVSGTPEEVFDAFTGDVSGWWDHTFSKEPLRLYIDPTPGGGFHEVFDEEGNGVLHATVNLVKRGEELQFVGPLGFAGLGVNLRMTHRFTFTAEGESTRIKVSVHGIGEVQEGWAEAVQGVWEHFLDERFKPYVEEGGGSGR